MNQWEQQVDEYVEQERLARHIPGLTVAVVRAGEVVKATGYGLANLEQQVPATAETIYPLASVSKQFTATAAMFLYQAGFLNLDDHISEFFDRIPKTWKEVTVRHLLTMTSGIIDVENDLPSIEETVAMLKKEYTDLEIVGHAAARPLHFAPGDSYAYTNTGYHMLGMIVRKLTGLKYSDFLKERVFDPLDMQNTRANDLSEIVPHRARGYWWTNEKWVNGPYVSQAMSNYAAGGLRSTVLDLAKWDAALYTDKILKPSTIDLMWSPTTLNSGLPSNYGFGWMIGDKNAHRFVRHSGSRESGFETSICRYLDDKLTIIVLTNLFRANPPTISEGIAGIIESSLA